MRRPKHASEKGGGWLSTEMVLFILTDTPYDKGMVKEYRPKTVRLYPEDLLADDWEIDNTVRRGWQAGTKDRL